MQTTSMTHRSIVSLAKTAIVAAIYVVMTLMLSPLSFGIVQSGSPRCSTTRRSSIVGTSGRLRWVFFWPI